MHGSSEEIILDARKLLYFYLIITTRPLSLRHKNVKTSFLHSSSFGNEAERCRKEFDEYKVRNRWEKESGCPLASDAPFWGDQLPKDRIGILYLSNDQKWLAKSNVEMQSAVISYSHSWAIDLINKAFLELGVPIVRYGYSAINRDVLLFPWSYSEKVLKSAVYADKISSNWQMSLSIFKKCFTEGSLPNWDYPVTQNTFKEIKFILRGP